MLDSPEFVRDHVAAYLRNWRQLIRLSGAYGYEPVCVLQPTGGFDVEYAVPIMVETFGMDRETALEWIDAFRALYQEADRQIAGLETEEPQRAVLNLHNYLAPAKDHFWDTVHVYDEVNLKLAAHLLDAMKPAVERRLADLD